MVLVDSTVWIRALAGREPERSTLDNLLQREVVLGHEFVYGELLMGEGAGGARSKLLAQYINYTHVAPVPHKDVVDLVRARRLYGKKLGWIDAHLLAAALVYGAPLYTADIPLETAAKALGVSYDP